MAIVEMKKLFFSLILATFITFILFAVCLLIGFMLYLLEHLWVVAFIFVCSLTPVSYTFLTFFQQEVE